MHLSGVSERALPALRSTFSGLGHVSAPVAALTSRVARAQGWYALTVTSGPTRSPHFQSKPKLRFIRTPVIAKTLTPLYKYPCLPLENLFSLFFFPETHENAQGPFQGSDVALYFVLWRKKPHNSGSFWILKHSLTEHKRFLKFLIGARAK